MKVKVITSLEELPQFDTEQPVFSDIETQGLYIRTRLIQLYQPTTNDSIYILDIAPIGYFPEDYNKNLQAAITYLKDLWLVFYNSSYDLGTLNLVPKKTDDLFYAVKSAYPEFMEFALDKVTNKLPYTKGLYAGLDKKALQKAGFVLGAYLSQNQLKYSALDVLALAKMWEDDKIQTIITKNFAYKVDILSQIYALQYQQNGLYVDLPTRNKKLMEFSEKAEKLRKEFPEGFNPNSYIQVRKYLDTDKSDHDALVTYAMSDRPLAPKAKIIMELKSALKSVSYLESINFEKMYTKFNVAGAITGRFTSSGGALDNGFNAQQIPRPLQPLFKSDLTIKGIKTVIVGLDYSTLELRLACTIFGEENMYRQLMNGEDLHTAMAMMTTGKPLHPEKGILGSDYDEILSQDNNATTYLTKTDRTLAKSINFGYVFGMSAPKYKNYAFVSYGVTVTDEGAIKLRNDYFDKYPAFKTYHKHVWDNYKKPSYIYKTALGRRVKPKLGTDGINGPVQGSGAETTKLAVHYLVDKYPEALKLISNVVHDAIYLRVPEVDKEIWIERLKEAMVKGWTEISKCSLFKYKDIPMPVGE